MIIELLGSMSNCNVDRKEVPFLQIDGLLTFIEKNDTAKRPQRTSLATFLVNKCDF